MRREQKRATLAYEQVATIAGNASKKKPYGRMAHKLPILIRQAGLAQALAFADAKDGKQLLEHLGATMHGVGMIAAGTRESLLAASRESELLAYMNLTREVQAALVWYKRYAQSVLNVDQTDEVPPNA